MFQNLYINKEYNIPLTTDKYAHTVVIPNPRHEELGHSKNKAAVHMETYLFVYIEMLLIKPFFRKSLMICIFTKYFKLFFSF